MDRSRLLLLAALTVEARKAMKQAERDSADAYAGPNKSFPLYKDGSHLAAAWDLAGHADDPEAVRRKILAFAEAHGLMDHLPLSARHEQDRRAITKKALVTQDDDEQPVAEHPEGAALSDLLSLSFAHEVSEGDEGQMRVLRDFAASHNLALPQPTVSEQVVQKATSSAVVAKAWAVPQGALIEGWVSTEDEDQEQDIVLVEAFNDSLASYAARRMPLSSEHATKGYPVGHGQRIALIKNGVLQREATHPSDPAAFEHLPTSGTGVYGRFLVTDPTAARAVTNGNVGGFSWIGKAHYQPRPGGQGRIFRRVDPWMECTIAAYPINVAATLTATTTL